MVGVWGRSPVPATTPAAPTRVPVRTRTSTAPSLVARVSDRRGDVAVHMRVQFRWIANR